MSKPDKPKESEASKEQAKFAQQTGALGASIRRKNVDKMLGDKNRNVASQGTAMAGAASAKIGKAQLQKSRIATQMKTSGASGGADSISANAFTAKAQSGLIDTSREISQGITSTANAFNTASNLGHGKTMHEFVKSNQRKQAAMDAATGIAMAGLYAKEHYSTKDKDTKKSAKGKAEIGTAINPNMGKIFTGTSQSSSNILNPESIRIINGGYGG